jgi:F420-non-reducing hydrogenase iron-sulfur subunit
MTKELTRTLAIFYCQNVPESGEEVRQSLEKRYGKSIRLFPMPCSGRIDIVHLLRALEEFADAVYVITCPEGTCRYLEGNKRIKKRIERAKSIIESIGLEKERLNLITPAAGDDKFSLTSFSGDIMEAAMAIPSSPVRVIKAHPPSLKASARQGGARRRERRIKSKAQGKA